jgi:type 1 glutamine amidotransferase
MIAGAARMPRTILLLAALWVCISPLVAGADPPVKKKLLLVAQGPDGHPKTTHEYQAGLKILQKSLAPAGEQLEIKLVMADGDWEEGPELVKSADGVVLYLAEGAKWIHGDPRRLEALAQLSARGGGLVALHWATGAKEARYIAGFQKLLGGCHGGEDRKYKFLETTVKIVDKDHPITQGIADFTIKDEFYYRLKFIGDERGLQPILTAKIDEEDHAVSWAWERPDGGRSFGFTGLHFHENWRREEYRRLVSQAVLWTLKLDAPEKDWPGKVEDEDYTLPEK